MQSSGAICVVRVVQTGEVHKGSDGLCAGEGRWAQSALNQVGPRTCTGVVFKQGGALYARRSRLVHSR